MGLFSFSLARCSEYLFTVEGEWMILVDSAYPFIYERICCFAKNVVVQHASLFFMLHILSIHTIRRESFKRIHTINGLEAHHFLFFVIFVVWYGMSFFWLNILRVVTLTLLFLYTFADTVYSTCVYWQQQQQKHHKRQKQQLYLCNAILDTLVSRNLFSERMINNDTA